MRSWYLLFLLWPIVSLGESQLETVEFSSPSRRVAMLEMYTSEGCSSCPPADRWLSQYKSDERLWREIVPLAFHVDYWNYLGWRDRFAKAQHTQRQQTYARLGHVNSVYTPGFIKNGREWRGFFNRTTPAVGVGDDDVPMSRSPSMGESHAVGVITARVEGGQVTVRFFPQGRVSGALHINAALLGFGLTSEIKNGENAGHSLQHDFVVLHSGTVTAKTQVRTPTETVYTGSIVGLFDTAAAPAATGRRQYAVAVWVNLNEDLTPIQAAGTWLRWSPGGP